jgi:teichuronic acid exporter
VKTAKDASNGKNMRSGLRWSAIDTFGSELLGIAFLIVLSRLLSPAEYGLMAMMGVFFAFTRLLIDAGLSRALVQRPEISADDETTVFYANIVMGIVVSLTLFSIAPLAASFFNEPSLVPLMQVLALKPVLTSFAPVQLALLIRAMDFRTQAIIEIAANLLSGGVTVILAWQGFGAWALVAQSLTWAVVKIGLLWLLRPWRPRGHFSRASLVAMWPFSWRLLATGFVDTIFDRLYEIAVGRLFSAIDLGLFTRARQMQRAPTQAVVSIVGRVSFASYARLQGDPEQLIAAFRRMQRAMACYTAPAMGGMAAVSVPLVVLMLSSAWAAAAPFLVCFALIGLCQPLLQQRQTMMTSIGRTDALLRLAVARHALSVVILVLTWRHGALAMAAGLAGHAVLSLLLSSWTVSRLIAYPLRAQFADILPGWAAGALCGGAAWTAGQWLPDEPWIALPAQIAVGAIVWLSVVLPLRHGVFAGPIGDALSLLGRKRKSAEDAR